MNAADLESWMQCVYKAWKDELDLFAEIELTTLIVLKRLSNTHSVPTNRRH